MSLSRLFLRQMLIQCLKARDEQGRFVTMAQHLVFDSAIVPLESTEDKYEFPLVAVYTERDDNTLDSRGRGVGENKNFVDVSIEFGIMQYEVVREENGTVKETVFSPNTTDAETEAVIDIMEAQIWEALFHPTRSQSVLLQKSVKDVPRYSSTPFRDAKDNLRLSMRELQFTFELTPNCLPVPAMLDSSNQIVGLPGQPQDLEIASALKKLATATPQISFAPHLNDMLKEMRRKPETSGAIEMIMRQSQGLPLGVVNMLDEVGMGVDILDPETWDEDKDPDISIEIDLDPE